jgi:hypothetical protein
MTTRPKRQLLHALAILLALPKQAFAKATITYDDLTALQVTFETLPTQQRDKLLIKQQVVERGGVCDWGCQPLKIWVISNNKRIDVPLSVETPDYDLVGQNLPLNSNTMFTLGLSTDLKVKTPAGSAIQAKYLLDALKQINRLIYRFALHRKGLLKALFIPDITTLEVYYQGPVGTTQLREGAKTTTIQQKSTAYTPVRFNRDFLAQHPTGVLLFPAPLTEIVPVQ